jgi:hypothetical protein
MNVEVSDEDIKYLYSIVPGISYIHGGKHILKNSRLPHEIAFITHGLLFTMDS